MGSKSFHNLIVWQKSMQFACDVYTLTELLPQSERFGLASQLQRAAASIPSNIAEGSKRAGRREFCHFCYIARGSAAEIETQLLLIQGIYPHIIVDKHLNTIEEIQKMLTNLTKTLT